MLHAFPTIKLDAISQLYQVVQPKYINSELQLPLLQACKNTRSGLQTLQKIFQRNLLGRKFSQFHSLSQILFHFTLRNIQIKKNSKTQRISNFDLIMDSSDKHVYSFGISRNKISTNKEVCYLGEGRIQVSLSITPTNALVYHVLI